MLKEALRSLVAGEFAVLEQELYPRESVFAFTHPLTQEVAMPPLGERRVAAQCIGRPRDRRAVPRAPGRAIRPAGRALGGRERTTRKPRAPTRAGAWVGTTDPTAAMRHWRKVRELADALPKSEEAAALGLSARLFALASGWRLGLSDQEAEALFTEAERMAAEAQDVWSRTLLLVTYATILFATRGQDPEALTAIRQAAALAEESGDPSLEVVVAVSSYAFYLVGEYSEVGPC